MSACSKRKASGPRAVGADEALARRATRGGSRRASRRRGSARPRRRRARGRRARRARGARCGSRGPPGCSTAGSRRRAPIATSCSRNSGLPSARRTIPAAPGTSRTSSSASSCPSGSRAMTERPDPGANHAGAHLHEFRASEAQDEDRVRAGERLRRSRGGPGASARPSGRRRPRARAGAGRPRTRAAAARPERLVGLHRRAVAEADRAQHRARERLVAVEQRGDPGRGPLAADLAHDLRERAVGDVLAVGQAAPDRDRRVVADVVQQLADQPRLADAGGSRHRHGDERALVARAAPCIAQRRELRVAADERARRRGVLRPQPQQARRRELAAARGTGGPGSSSVDAPSRSAIRAAGEDLPVGRGRLQRRRRRRTARRSPGARRRRRTPRRRRARRGPAPGRGSPARRARRAARRPRAAR